MSTQDNCRSGMRPLYFEQDGGYFFFRLRPFYNLTGEYEEGHTNYNTGCCLSEAYVIAPFLVTMNDNSAERASIWFEATARAHGFEPIRDDYNNRETLDDHEPEYAALCAATDLAYGEGGTGEHPTTIAEFAAAHAVPEMVQQAQGKDNRLGDLIDVSKSTPTIAEILAKRLGRVATHDECANEAVRILREAKSKQAQAKRQA